MDLEALEFPRLLYKLGGSWALESGNYSVREVATAEEAEALHADGWRLDQYAAAAVGSEVATAPVVPTLREQLDAALAELPDDHTDPEYVVHGMRAHFGELFTDADEAKVRELVIPPAPPVEVVTEALATKEISDVGIDAARDSVATVGAPEAPQAIQDPTSVPEGTEPQGSTPPVKRGPGRRAAKD